MEGYGKRRTQPLPLHPRCMTFELPFQNCCNRGTNFTVTVIVTVTVTVTVKIEIIINYGLGNVNNGKRNRTVYRY